MALASREGVYYIVCSRRMARLCQPTVLGLCISNVIVIGHENVKRYPTPVDIARNPSTIHYKSC
jgi:hypothetical protein